MSTLAQNIAKQIIDFREKNNLTQRDLAVAMGVQTATITRIENGETGITSTVLEKFCKVSGQIVSFEKSTQQQSKVLAVCDYVISKLYKLLDDDSYELTNLKLQKLLYYIQMEYLGKFDKVLFEHKFVAWEHGPVHPDVYNRFKESDHYGIDPEGIIPPSNLSREEESAIDQVIIELGGATAWELRELTHEETPWEKRHQYKKNNPITIEDLKEFYPEYLKLKERRKNYRLDDTIINKSNMSMSPP